MIYFIFIFYNLVHNDVEILNFGHKPKIHFNLTNHEINNLRKIGEINDIEKASKSLGKHLPLKIVKIFTSAKNCLESNPIKDMDIYSEFTRYSAFDDLIKSCVLIEYNKLNKTNLTNDEFSLLMFEWFDEISLSIFDLQHNIKPLSYPYWHIGACDKQINYHLVVSSLLIYIEVKDFDPIKFLNYLFRNPDDEEMCELYFENK